MNFFRKKAGVLKDLNTAVFIIQRCRRLEQELKYNNLSMVVGYKKLAIRWLERHGYADMALDVI